ncbi:hypothetical protein [Pseudomonas fluorescens]|uniref:hypothetical protein n=1 Tax=Pseudomonas fluorescens TaxID=294 RepID=UPI0007D0AEA2|nr:hypothetical protein [Pseudomonas fluorescens]
MDEKGIRKNSPYSARKPIKGTVARIYKLLWLATDNVQVVVNLDEGRGTAAISAPKDQYSVGDRIGDE